MRVEGTNRATDHEQRGGRDLAAAVHELRTPLATVQGFLATLLERGEELGPAVREQITEVAHRNAVVLGQRIDSLLQYERLAVEPLVDQAPSRLQDVVSRVVEDCTGILSDHRVRIAVDPRTWAQVDHDALSHVLANLLSNAARHSPAGSAITVRATEQTAHVRVEVVDQGEGIPASDLPHVFEAFYRGADHPGSGTGLGLTVVQRYVSLWGGTVAIASRPGEGTTVTFTLERAPAQRSTEVAEHSWS